MRDFVAGTKFSPERVRFTYIYLEKQQQFINAVAQVIHVSFINLNYLFLVLHLTRRFFPLQCSGIDQWFLTCLDLFLFVSYFFWMASCFRSFRSFVFYFLAILQTLGRVAWAEGGVAVAAGRRASQVRVAGKQLVKLESVQVIVRSSVLSCLNSFFPSFVFISFLPLFSFFPSLVFLLFFLWFSFPSFLPFFSFPPFFHFLPFSFPS